MKYIVCLKYLTDTQDHTCVKDSERLIDCSYLQGCGDLEYSDSSRDTSLRVVLRYLSLYSSKEPNWLLTCALTDLVLTSSLIYYWTDHSSRLISEYDSESKEWMFS